MVDFEWYRSFIAVYRAGTVTGAAKARFLTQPAISQHIAALESANGHALFQRTPRRMIPTEHGKALYSRTASALDGLEKVSANLQNASITEVPIIRLGTPLDYFHEIGFKKLKESQLRLQIELGEADKMIDNLSHGRLDAVIATQQLQAANIDYTRIDQEDFCLVAPANDMLPADLNKTGKPNQIEHVLLDKNWISYSAELPIIRRFWHVAFKRRPTIEPVMIVPSLLLIRKAVEFGVGISVLPRYLCRELLNTGEIKILWEPKKSMLNDLWIATRKIDRNKPEIEQLILRMQ